MSWMFEYGREGYLGEAKCPRCGAFTEAIFHEDGSYEILCWYCTARKED